MNGIVITDATADDRAKLIDWFSVYEVAAQRDARVDCFLEHNATMLAKDLEKIVGVLQWSIVEDMGAGVVEMQEVMVDKQYRRQGIGSALVAHALSSIQKTYVAQGVVLRKIFLFVAKENLPAIALYERHGFRHVADLGTLFDDCKVESFYVLDVRSV